MEQPTFVCPSFSEFTMLKKEFAKHGESTEPTGFCKHIEYSRQDGTVLGSCPYHGNPELCMADHTEVSVKLRAKL